MKEKYEDWLHKYLPLLFLIVIALLVIGIENDKSKNVKKRQLLFCKGEFSIGYGVTRTYSNGSLMNIGFDYTVNGKEYSKLDYFFTDVDDKDAALEIFGKKSMLDEKYLVLYDKDNPKEAIIRVDYAIKDSADFKKHIKHVKLLRTQSKCDSVEKTKSQYKDR